MKNKVTIEDVENFIKELEVEKLFTFHYGLD